MPPDSCPAAKEPAPEDSHMDPDAWVKRDSRLVRRTGRHPLNAETPAEELLNADTTPSGLHYVRNHGTVPRWEWETHTVTVCTRASGAKGGETELCKLSMDDIAALPKAELKLTFACDGNRRGEVNTVKRSQGFDWGPTAVSTATWGGALLRDLLLKVAGGAKDKDGLLKDGGHVWFEGGADEHLHGEPYGTSVPMALAMDASADLLLAYAMNGERLPPDHGFPLRVVIPGHVGGRMVKWLTKIVISDQESQNSHHFHDNRVLPRSVDNPALAHEHWKAPENMLMELNINSVILSPAHGDRVPLDSPSRDVALRGYAYTGGGRKIRTVEVKLSGIDGECGGWHDCRVVYPEGYAPRHGTRWWVMCTWEVTLPAWRLARCAEVAVRAMDTSYNTQPEDIRWNLLGMMNNTWYRVKLSVIDPAATPDAEDDEHTQGSVPALQFAHPIALESQEPPRKGDGDAGRPWMAPEGVAPGQRKHGFEEKAPARSYTAEEVSHHKQRDDCWVSIDGHVYDLTEFMSQHPGGAGPIMAYAGGDASEVFASIHAEDAYALKSCYVIGRLVKSDEPAAARHVSQRAKQPPQTPDGHPIALRSRAWTRVTLVSREELTRDVRRFKFALPSKDDRLWLPWGKHLYLALRPTELDLVVRPYTPVAPILQEEDDGTCTLVVKIYFPGGGRPGGELTTLLEKLPVGGEAEVRGPDGKIAYLGNQTFEVQAHYLHATRLNLVCGGTGVTPCFAIARAVLEADRTAAGAGNADLPRVFIRMVFANKTPADVLLRGELDALARAHPDHFECWHVASEVPQDEEWPYSTGHVTEEIMRAHTFEARGDTLALVCGPPPFVLNAAVPQLESLGHDEDHLFEF